MDKWSEFSRTIFNQRYAMLKKDGQLETWAETSQRVAKNVLHSVDAPKSLIQDVANIIEKRQFIPGGRYLYSAGRPFHQTQNCLLLRAEDSREGWADLLYRCSMALMTGAGIGVNYSPIRAEGKPIRKTGGVATGPTSLMQMINEAGRGVRSGGNRRGAIWAGLSWKHADIMKFIRLKDWIPEVRSLKEKDVDFPGTLDLTNISVCLDDDFFAAYGDDKNPLHSHATSVYRETVRRMLKTGEPGFSIDTGKNVKEDLRNACTEITSADDSDICNLGSLNLACISSVEEMSTVLNLAIPFLLAGTVYSDVPYQKVDSIRTKNRRLGLGLMGIHEWLLTHGKKYGPDSDLEGYLNVYAESTKVSHEWADKWELSRPVKTRAIAPNGTIGIISETSSGIEPIFCVAMKRRYAKGDAWNYQYVIDPTAKRLIDGGISPHDIEDAYDLANDVERRVAFQAWIQQFVDHGISSTINLPEWGTELNNEDRVIEFGNMLFKYLPKLRGITCYPNGARGGQPLQSVKYETALKHLGTEFKVEATDVCDITKGESCGS
jgi:ribonucleoside-diphosphate reductase alpha chain